MNAWKKLPSLQKIKQEISTLPHLCKSLMAKFSTKINRILFTMVNLTSIKPKILVGIHSKLNLKNCNHGSIDGNLRLMYKVIIAFHEF